jgi:hypothetical protein
MWGGVVKPTAWLPLWQVEQFVSVAACLNPPAEKLTVLWWQVPQS